MRRQIGGPGREVVVAARVRAAALLQAGAVIRAANPVPIIGAAAVAVVPGVELVRVVAAGELYQFEISTTHHQARDSKNGSLLAY